MSLRLLRTNSRPRRQLLHNGVNDPGILKAVFLAGGPGSGKSYAVSQLFGIPKNAAALMTSPGGLKLVNSDPFFEHNLRSMGIDPKILATLPPETFAALTEGRDSPRGRAKTTREAFLRHWTNGRLGLILDGTGDDFDKIRKQSEGLRSLGYDTMMVFVNTSLEVAKKRNRQRARSLPDHLVEEIWGAVQQNLGAFQDYFGGSNIIIVDATVAGPPSGNLVAAAEAFLRRPVSNRIGKAWIASQKAAVIRNNPTGFSVRRSGLDWIIADASDKAVPGKRFSSEAAARSELAKLDGGAVSMAASPAAPPRPAPALPSMRAAGTASRSSPNSDGDVRVAQDVVNALKIEEMIRSGEPRFKTVPGYTWFDYADKFIAEQYYPKNNYSDMFQKELVTLTPTERARNRRRARKFRADVVFRPQQWSGWPLPPDEWEVSAPDRRITAYRSEAGAWDLLDRMFSLKDPPSVASADVRALKEALRAGISIPRYWDGRREGFNDETEYVMGGKNYAKAYFHHMLSGGKEIPYILFHIDVMDDDGHVWDYLAVVPTSGGPPIAAANRDRIKAHLMAAGGELVMQKNYAAPEWDAHFLPFLEQVAAGEHTDWDSAHDIINADGLVEAFIKERVRFFPLRRQKKR